MTDIEIKEKIGKFKLRASALIIKDNKLLVHKAKKYDGYCLPGGHVEIGESTKEAIIRETKEELNIDVNVLELFCVDENLYNCDGVISQEINYYYKVESKDDIPDESFIVKELDKGTLKEHIFSWIPLELLEKSNLKPEHIAHILSSDPNLSNKILLSDNRNN